MQSLEYAFITTFWMWRSYSHVRCVVIYDKAWLSLPWRAWSIWHQNCQPVLHCLNRCKNFSSMKQAAEDRCTALESGHLNLTPVCILKILGRHFFLAHSARIKCRDFTDVHINAIIDQRHQQGDIRINRYCSTNRNLYDAQEWCKQV